MRHLVWNAAIGLMASAAVASGGAACATAYDFSYAFAGDGLGHTITGSFDGTGPINAITNISDVHMSLDGSPLSGPFYAYSYTPPSSTNCGAASCFTMGSAVVSGDSSVSNFVFSTSSSNAVAGSSTFFYVIQPWYNPPQTIASQFNSPQESFNGYNGQYVAANFSVTAVPEPAAWALLLVGFAGLGATIRARRAGGLAA